jgi:5'-nucleotidase
MKILLTNDDGIQAVGMRALFRVLVDAGHDVTCVAPISEMSAVGHAVTMSMPLKVKRFRENGFRGTGVSGTPADCVKLALGAIMRSDPPQLVVSGINAGANCGVDILYSGTVSAATESALMGLPSLAVSYDNFRPESLDGPARYVAGFIERQPWSELPPRCVLNLNFPDMPVEQTKGLKVCRLTRAAYDDWYDKRVDPRGNEYYWLDGVIPPEKLSKDSDRFLVSHGYITLTPLKFEFTDVEAMNLLSEE